MKRALRYLIGVIRLSVLAFTLGSAWVNFLCSGLGVICAMAYAVMNNKYDIVCKTN